MKATPSERLRPRNRRRKKQAEILPGNRDHVELNEAWEASHSWTLDSFLESRHESEDSEMIWRWRIQGILSECLKPGEALIFRYSKGEGGAMSWGLGLHSPDPVRWQSLELVLRSLGQSFAFEENTAGEDRPADHWRELLPSTWKISVSGKALGFGEWAAGSPDEVSMEVPVLRWDWRLHRLPYLLAECDGLQAVEVAIGVAAESKDWGDIADAVREDVKQREDRATAKRLEDWCKVVTEERRYELRCRVAVDEGSSPRAWADVLGREVYRSEAELVGNLVGIEPCGASRTFGGEDLPMLIPPFVLLREAGIRRRHNRRVPRLPSEGVVVGCVEGIPLKLTDSGRERHTYVVGATGTGKSTLLFNMIRQDMENGEGVIVLDPHGDLYERVFDAVPENRADNVILLDPSASGSVPGFNPLALPDDRFRDIRASYIVGEFLRLFHQLWDVPEAFGPMFEYYFRNALLLLMRNRPASKYSLADFPKVFIDKDFRRQALHFAELETVKDFWQKMAVRTTGDTSLENMTPYMASKLDCFSNGGFLSQVVCRGDTTLHFDEIMNERKILLVNLNKGLIGARESRILGMLLMTQIFSTALGRSVLPESKRIPCHLYVDEFQNFVSDGMADMLSEARKFGLQLTLANQTLQQLTAHRGVNNLLDSVLGNVGNLLAFRLGIRESEVLEPFTRPFTQEQMQRLPNFHAFARVLDANGPLEPVVMKTLDV